MLRAQAESLYQLLFSDLLEAFFPSALHSGTLLECKYLDNINQKINNNNKNQKIKTFFVPLANFLLKFLESLNCIL
jgi:hypothetical protein